jgi:DNA-binding response OmpR family regulator
MVDGQIKEGEERKQRPKLLHVEDHEGFHNALKSALQLIGYDVTWAQTLEAVRSLPEEELRRFVIGIVDGDLGREGDKKIQGKDVIDLLRSRGFSSPVIGLSATASVEGENPHLKGANAVLPKGAPFEDLVNSMDTLLEKPSQGK